MQFNARITELRLDVL